MNTTMKPTVTGEGNAPRVLNAVLNHCIVRVPKGFALYDGFGYSGTFDTEAAAVRHYNAPCNNFDHNSTPDGV